MNRDDVARRYRGLWIDRNRETLGQTLGWYLYTIYPFVPHTMTIIPWDDEYNPNDKSNPLDYGYAQGKTTQQYDGLYYGRKICKRISEENLQNRWSE